VSRRTILVVDDQEDVRSIARLSLELLGGWSVLTAESGAEALTIAADRRPDAILLDVMMPGLDGPTTVERLRSDPATAGIPVVLLTAKVQAMDQRRFAQLPISGVLPKPFDPLELSSQVSAVLGW
jgi:CheY-like chemotaxis protein